MKHIFHTAKKRGFFIVILVCSIGLGNCCCFDKNKCRNAEICGENLPLKINYKGSPTANEHGLLKPPYFIIFSITPNENKSLLLFYVVKMINNEPEIKQLISVDRGITWKAVDWPMGYRNLGGSYSHWMLAINKKMSNIDFRVIYDCNNNCQDGFPVSTDGGNTWTHVNSALEDGGLIAKIDLIETGMHSTSRLYARIQSIKDARIGVSDDYGRNFKLLPKGLDIIAESRANASILYGLLNPSYFESNDIKTSIDKLARLGVSKDGGKSWEVMKGSLEITGHKIYRNIFNREDNRSWRKHPDDEEWPVGDGIMQIESDPKQPEYIYVLTTRGLYLSRDMGKTFRLSSLARGFLYSIDRIAVDPLDGRYLYAVVDLVKFYRSSDYGCTWELMPPPAE